MSEKYSFNKLSKSAKINSNASDPSEIEGENKKINQQQKSEQNISSLKRQAKKNEGWLSFINEKLNQWPLWIKITSTFTSQSGVLSISDNPQQPKWKKNCMKIQQLPWEIFFQRCWSKSVYKYYHCKEDNITYFFQIPNFGQAGKDIVDAKDLHHEIWEPPEEVYNITCSMPTKTAIVLLQNYFKQRQQQKAKGY